MIVETERLKIRSIELQDEQGYIEMASDGSLQEVFGDCTDCREWMNSWIQEAQALDQEDNPSRKYLAYAITEKHSGTLLGSVGSSYYKDLGQVGITFFIGGTHRGKGFAAEAAAAYTQYFFAHYDIHKLIATVKDDNAASWKTIERAGFTLTETKMYQDINDEREELYRFYELNDKISRVLMHWELSGDEIKRIYDTTWQVGDNYVLKIYQDAKMLERNLKMLRILKEMHIPVAQIVPACDNASYVEQDNVYYFLSEKLSGSNIVQINDNKDIAVKMGEIIANLHRAFKECDTMEGLWNNSLLDEMNGWVRMNLERNGWNYVSRDAYEKAVSQLAGIYDQLPIQLIHRDIHFGNFLFADSVFSGYIDFDLSQRNIRIFDICYFLLGLLSEEENLHITEEMWFDFARDVFAGYESILRLSPAEKKAVPYVMECIELLFVSYFEEVKNFRCARNAYKIYEFIVRHEDRL